MSGLTLGSYGARSIRLSGSMVNASRLVVSFSKLTLPGARRPPAEPLRALLGPQRALLGAERCAQ
jgi:hypothetical protein